MFALRILDEEEDLDAVAATTLLQGHDPSVSIVASGEQTPHGQMGVGHIRDIEWLPHFCHARRPASLHFELVLNGRGNGRERLHLLKFTTLPKRRLAGECIERHQPEDY